MDTKVELHTTIQGGYPAPYTAAMTALLVAIHGLIRSSAWFTLNTIVIILMENGGELHLRDHHEICNMLEPYADRLPSLKSYEKAVGYGAANKLVQWAASVVE